MQERLPGTGCELCGMKCPPGGIANYGGRRVCFVCLEGASMGSNICPSCGSTLAVDEEHQLAFTLESAGKHGEANKQIAAMVIVCPLCRAIFMDEFQYKLLQKC